MVKKSDMAMVAVAGAGLFLLYKFGSGLGTSIGKFFENPIANLQNGAWDLLTGGQWSQYQKELGEYNAKITAQAEAQKQQQTAINATIAAASQGNVAGAVEAYKASVNYRIEALANSPGGIDAQDTAIIKEQAAVGEVRVSRDAQIAAQAWNSSKEAEYLQKEIDAAMKDLEYYRQMYTAGRMDFNSWSSLSTAITAQLDRFKAAQQAASTSTQPVYKEVAAAADTAIPGNSSPIYSPSNPSPDVVMPPKTYNGVWSFTGSESGQVVQIVQNSCHPLESVGCTVYVTVQGGRGGSTFVHYKASQGSPHLFKNGADQGYASVGKTCGISQGDVAEIRMVN